MWQQVGKLRVTPPSPLMKSASLSHKVSMHSTLSRFICDHLALEGWEGEERTEVQRVRSCL